MRIVVMGSRSGTVYFSQQMQIVSRLRGKK
jgi:hypothetical protein